MPDLDLIKQDERGVRDRRGRFARGRSGNPAGRLTLAGEGEIKSCATGLSVRSFSPLINTVPEYELAKHCAARLTPN